VDSNADDRPGTTGKQETWIEDAGLDALKAAVPGSCAGKDVLVVEYQRWSWHMKDTG